MPVKWNEHADHLILLYLVKTGVKAKQFTELAGMLEHEFPEALSLKSLTRGLEERHKTLTQLYKAKDKQKAKANAAAASQKRKQIDAAVPLAKKAKKVEDDANGPEQEEKVEVEGGEDREEEDGGGLTFSTSMSKKVMKKGSMTGKTDGSKAALAQTDDIADNA